MGRADVLLGEDEVNTSERTQHRKDRDGKKPLIGHPKSGAKGQKRASDTVKRGSRKGKKSSGSERAYSDVLDMSAEIEKEMETIEEGQFSCLDEYSMNEKLLIFQSELLNKIKTVNEYKETLQRVAADFDNYRKRNEKDRENIINFANERLILNLLEVVDNLDRAVNPVANGVDADDPFYQGIELIHNHFIKILSDEGVRAINETGVAFDPFRHDAMMQVVNDELDENTVTDVFQKGYFLKDKVIRPAKVRISKKEE